MRAEDVLRVAVMFEASVRPGETVESVLLREGVAYDELSRFCLLGSFRFEELVAEENRESITPEEAYGRVWIDGFLLGLWSARMGIGRSA